MKYKDYTGQRFNKLVATKRIGMDKTNKHSVWEFVCDCGNTITSPIKPIRNGAQKSCGCWKKEQNRLPKEYVPTKGNYEDTRRKVYTDYYNSAKKRGLSFDIAEDRFYEKIQQPCHYCGETASNEVKNRGTIRFPDRPMFIYSGLDRVDNMLGYTDENTVPCCTMCNRMKKAFSLNYFLEKVKQVYEHTYALPCNDVLESKDRENAGHNHIGEQLPKHVQTQAA